MSEVRYFKIDNFERDLTEYLKCCSAWYVTAMCPVCTPGDGGFTSGIYVTVKREG
jgi:hypothetical protein